MNGRGLKRDNGVELLCKFVLDYSYRNFLNFIFNDVWSLASRDIMENEIEVWTFLESRILTIASRILGL